MGSGAKKRRIPHEDVLASIERRESPHAPVTAPEVADDVGCARRTAHKKLRELTDRGELRTKKVGARSRVWWRPASPPETTESPPAATGGGHGGLLAIVREVSRETVRAETRTEIAMAACRAFAATDRFAFAVAGDFSAEYEHFNAWASDGIGDAYLRDVLDTMDDRSLEDGLGVRATKSGDIQVARTCEDVPGQFWPDVAVTHGFEAYAIIPLVFERAVYGLLGVFCSQEQTFDEDERAVLGEIGELVGHAINALERRDALVSDEVLEVEFRSRALGRPFVDAGLADGVLTIDRIVPLPDGTYLQYATVETTSPGDLEAYLDALEGIPTVATARALTRDDETGRVESHIRSDGFITALGTYGGRLTDLSFEGGDVHLVAELPRQRTVRDVLTAMRDVVDDVRLVRRQPRQRRTKTPTELATAANRRLTDRQRTALETAYFGGYFEWPRDSTAEDLAEALDVSPPTFHDHFRKGQRTVFELLFDDDRRIEEVT